MGNNNTNTKSRNNTNTTTESGGISISGNVIEGALRLITANLEASQSLSANAAKSLADAGAWLLPLGHGLLGLAAAQHQVRSEREGRQLDAQIESDMLEQAHKHKLELGKMTHEHTRDLLVEGQDLRDRSLRSELTMIELETKRFELETKRANIIAAEKFSASLNLCASELVLEDPEKLALIPETAKELAFDIVRKAAGLDHFAPTTPAPAPRPPTYTASVRLQPDTNSVAYQNGSSE